MSHVVTALHHLARAMSESLREDVRVERAREEVRLAHRAIDDLVAEELQALPPVPPPAAEPAHPPAQPSQTEAVEGRGVVCSKARSLAADLDHALNVFDNGDATADECGIELLRISNELATESKRLRAPAPALCAMCLGTGTHDCPGGSVSPGDVERPCTGEWLLSEAPGGLLVTPGKVDADAFRATPERIEQLRRRAPKGLASVFGKWPGDESEEQLIDAMREAEQDVFAVLDQLAVTEGPFPAPPGPCTCPWANLSNCRMPIADCPQHGHEVTPANPRDAIIDGVRDRLRKAEVTPSGGAEALPSGWTAHCDYGAGCFQHEGGNARVQGDGKHSGTWWWQTGPGAAVKHAPTKLQAMCAALGIELLNPNPETWYGTWPGAIGAHYCYTADEAAQRALERYHAQKHGSRTEAPVSERTRRIREQQAAECKCWHVSGKRIANRWCSLHASEWQTLAEQRSELHEDGTPRAGCGYCASTPELDARERGLR